MTDSNLGDFYKIWQMTASNLQGYY